MSELLIISNLKYCFGAVLYFFSIGTLLLLGCDICRSSVRPPS